MPVKTQKTSPNFASHSYKAAIMYRSFMGSHEKFED